MNAHRLITRTEVLTQLLAAVAAIPAGEKLPVPGLRDALISQNDVLSGIQALIDAGRLDRATLRPPARPKVDRRGFKLADGEPALPLFDQVKAETARRAIQLQQASREIFGNRSTLWRLGGDIVWVRRGTADKVRAWLNRSAEEPDAPPGSKAGRGKAAIPASEVLPEIQAFLATEAVTRTRFEIECLRSGSALARLSKDGATIRPETVARIRAFIADHKTDMRGGGHNTAAALSGGEEPPQPEQAATNSPPPAPKDQEQRSGIVEVCDPAPAKSKPGPVALPTSASAPVFAAVLRREITDFCMANDVALSRFGRLCVGDPKFVSARLRNAERVLPRTAEKVRAFIANPPAELLDRAVPGRKAEAPAMGAVLPTCLKPGEIAWCEQCEQRVACAKAAQCASPFCKLKVRAA